jgi:uncharacterized membrane protein (DUF373 family)
LAAGGASRLSCSSVRAEEEAEMRLGAFGKTDWRKFATYEQFERLALVCVMALLGVLTAFAIVLAAIKIVGDLLLGESFLDKAALQDTFGLILAVIILLEFNHSIFVALTHRTGAIQARIVVLIAVLVVARKLMLQDPANVDLRTLGGFGGLLLALGGLYWLISDGDRRHAQARLNPPAAPDAHKHP